MKCVIPGVNIKVFGRAIHSLAKIGDELYIEPHSTGVSFRTVNSSRSAFASFHFDSRFFSHFDDGLGSQQPDAEDETVKCKVSMKAFISVFKSLAALERTVEKCKLVLDGEDAKLGVQLTCRHGIVKSCTLSFIECETLQAVYDKDSCTTHIHSQARVLSDAVLNFQLSQEEVTLSVSPRKTILRNYVDDEPDPGKAIHTMLTLQSEEFDVYDISGDCEVTFCLKELRAVLTFAEPVNLPITSHFSDPGSPIIFCVNNSPMFEGIFVLATLSQKPDTQVSGSHALGRRTPQSVHKRNDPESPSCSQAPSAMNRTVQSINESLRVESPTVRRPQKTNDIPRSVYENRETVSSACTSATHDKANPQKNNEAIPLSSSMQHRHASNINGSVSQPEISLLRLEANNMAAEEEEEVIPGTPPSKKFRFFFRPCFESTFDPLTLFEPDKILAEDSDDDS